MPFATDRRKSNFPSAHSAWAIAARVRAEVEDALTARRRALEIAATDKPLARVAALLVSISRNNGYEGRDPRVMPDTLTSGFVADLLGLDIALTGRAAGRSAPPRSDRQRSVFRLRLKDLAGLEALADGSDFTACLATMRPDRKVCSFRFRLRSTGSCNPTNLRMARQRRSSPPSTEFALADLDRTCRSRTPATALPHGECLPRAYPDRAAGGDRHCHHPRPGHHRRRCRGRRNHDPRCLQGSASPPRRAQ